MEALLLAQLLGRRRIIGIVAGDDDEMRLVLMLDQLLHHIHAVDLRHDHVENDGGGLEFRQNFLERVAVGRDLDFEAHLDRGIVDEPSEIRIVVQNKQSSRKHLQFPKHLYSLRTVFVLGKKYYREKENKWERNGRRGQILIPRKRSYRSRRKKWRSG